MEATVIRRAVPGNVQTLNVWVDDRECLAVFRGVGMANVLIEETDHAPAAAGWQAVSVGPGQLLTILAALGLSYVAFPENPEGTESRWMDGLDFVEALAELGG